MTDALITGKIVNWAIKRANETESSLASKLNIKLDRLLAWENEDERPSIRQAEDLAKKLKIPFGYLYFKSPPPEHLPLPDLRTIASTPANRPSPDFLDVLYDALRKRDWYREYMQNEGASILSFIGNSKCVDENQVASSIRDILKINDRLRRQARNWEEFLTLLIRKAEESRILVLRSGIVGSNTSRPLNVEEFRGFAISDQLAPVVFINEQDYKTAQIFTLAHELAHLWIGESGVSNPDYKLRANQQKSKIDQFCDKVAAQLLVPAEDFDLRWNESEPLDHNLQHLATHYRVSAFVILRRAYSIDKISSDIYQGKYVELLSRIRTKAGSGGGDFYNLVMSRNSANLTTNLLAAVAESKTSPVEAAGLLNIHVSTLRNIEAHLVAG